MLNKNYELVVVGQSFLNVIYALESLRNVSRVLVLEDQRLNFGSLYEHGLTELDCQYLLTLGRDQDVVPLQQLDQYASNKAIYVQWDQVRLILGRDPWDNVHELYRCLPQLFPFSFIHDHDYQDFPQLDSEDKKRLTYERESFNRDFSLYIERLGLASYRFKSLETIDIDFFLEECPLTLKLLFERFNQCLTDNPVLAKKFLYCMRGFFHKKYSSAHSDYEIFHLFLCLICRHYSLKQETLRERLIEAFLEVGGVHKKAQINDWRFFKSRPWSLELSTFEGIIHPDKLSFLGLNLRALRLSAHSKERFYHSVHVDITFHKNCLRPWLDHILYFSRSDAMASSLPSCTFVVQSERKLKGIFSYRRKSGSKISFFAEDLRAEVMEKLEEWYVGLSQQVADLTLSLGEEIYIDDSFYYKRNFVPYAKKVNLFDHSRADEKKSLKLVAYHGPQKNLSFGFYGQLLDLKEGSYFQ